MIDKELRKLSRADLLELLLEQRRENERLRAQLKQAKKLLASRQIEIADAGSIAEAALRLSGVFEAAQDAADRYLENVRRLAEEMADGMDTAPPEKEPAGEASKRESAAVNRETAAAKKEPEPSSKEAAAVKKESAAAAGGDRK